MFFGVIPMGYLAWQLRFHQQLNNLALCRVINTATAALDIAIMIYTGFHNATIA